MSPACRNFSMSSGSSDSSYEDLGASINDVRFIDSDSGDEEGGDNAGAAQDTSDSSSSTRSTEDSHVFTLFQPPPQAQKPEEDDASSSGSSENRSWLIVNEDESESNAEITEEQMVIVSSVGEEEPEEELQDCQREEDIRQPAEVESTLPVPSAPAAAIQPLFQEPSPEVSAGFDSQPSLLPHLTKEADPLLTRVDELPPGTCESQNESESFVIDEENSPGATSPRGEVLSFTDVEQARAAKFLWAGETQVAMSASHLLSVCEGHQADVTSTWFPALQDFPRVTGAHCLGRFQVAQGGACGQSLVALARAVVRNAGTAAWPEDTALRLVAGRGWGFHELRIGALLPGQAAEIALDVAIPAIAEGRTHQGERSAWVLDDGSGEPFGPLLVLEALYV